MIFQEWARALGKAGIRNVRLRTAEEPGQPQIDIQGTAENPIYLVTGIVLSRNELQLPGGRFRRSEAGRLAQWLDDLAAHGPAAKREKKGAFGLSAAELDRVRKDLATPVGFRTQGIARQEVVRKIAEPAKAAPATGGRGRGGTGRRQGRGPTPRTELRHGPGLRPAAGGLLPRAPRGKRPVGLRRGQVAGRPGSLAGRLGAGEVAARDAARACMSSATSTCRTSPPPRPWRRSARP